MTPTLWPTIAIDGELDSAEAEFLHANGAGAYSMSTLALMHTRRRHGLLVAALEPPLNHHVILSQVDATLKYKKRQYRLSTHRFPDVAPTPGYRLLQSFSQDPIPRFSYEIADGELEVTLSLVRGENLLIMAYTWFGPEPAKLVARPLLAMRPVGHLMSEHGAMMQRVSLRQGEVEVQPVVELPPVTIGHEGVFMGSPDWWRRFEYDEDRRSGIDHLEDLWTPGTIETVLEPEQSRYLWAAMNSKLRGTPSERVEETCAVLRSLDPGDEHTSTVRVLTVAAEVFRASECERPMILSSYPPEGVSFRDGLIALPGIHLLQNEVDAAKRVLRLLLAELQGGLLPAGIHEDGRVSGQPAADATLWLFQAARQLVASVGSKDPFVMDELYPALVAVFERVSSAERRILWLSAEGLVANGEVEAPLTWMDSRLEGSLVTPRRGLAVELQALWASGCDILAVLAREAGDEALGRRSEAARDLTRQAVRGRFWCDETGYPFDVIPEDETSELADPAIRPNAVLALDVDARCFEGWQAARIVEVARQRLLTPGGLRTLAPEHPQYLGHFEGMMREQQAAYHRGAAWPYLLGAFARAALRLAPHDYELQLDLRSAIEQGAERGIVVGHVAQLSSGEAPYQPGGSPAQAWSTGELLRALWRDLGL